MKTSVIRLKRMLPEFPRTIHLPWKPNAVRDDLVAKLEEAKIIFQAEECETTEKVDGANAGMMLYDGEPVIRNRSHILNKGYLKNTPAKIQFRSAWGWFYENKNRFEKLNEIAGGSVGVYGEWLYALHGIEYDKLPSLFVAFDIYDPVVAEFLAPSKARDMLQEAGFKVVPLLHSGPVKSWEQLETFCNEPSNFSDKDRREGVYVKVASDLYITHRFKMVRSDFVQGCRWNENKLTRNSTNVYE